MELTDNEMIDLRDLNDIIAADYVGEEFSGWFHEWYTWPNLHEWNLWRDVRN